MENRQTSLRWGLSAQLLSERRSSLNTERAMGAEGLDGQADPTVLPYPASFSDNNASNAVTVERGVSPRRARFLRFRKNPESSISTGQVHLVTIAHHRGLVFVFGARRGVRRGEGQGPGQAFRGRGVDAKQVNQFKPIGRPGGWRETGGIGFVLETGLVRPANLIISPFMLPFFPGAAPIKRMRSRSWLQCKKWKPSEPSH